MGATYNFYNCCCDDESSSESDSSLSSGNIVHLRSGADRLYTDLESGDLRWAGAHFPISAPHMSGLVYYHNLEYVHFTYTLKSIAFIKAREDGSTAHSMSLEYVVLDMAGNELRTISSGFVDIVAAPEDTWLGATLTSNTSDLKITPNEVVAAKITISANTSDNYTAYGSCSALVEI